MAIPRVAFLCTHNACRSQIAEALGTLLAADAFESCSAGTDPKEAVNPDAVRLLRRLYGLEIDRTQRPKPLSALPPVDLVVTMGCGVRCPVLPARTVEDWGLEDPTGKGDDAFLAVIQEIRDRVLELRARLLAQRQEETL